MAISPFQHNVSNLLTPLIATRHKENMSYPAVWGLAIVEAVIGYEWLISGLDKVFSVKYLPGLGEMLSTSIQNNPNSWWGTFIQQLVIPHAQIWAMLIEISELLIAIGFFAGALLWISEYFPAAHWTHWLNLSAMLAIAGGILMTTNYYLMAGHGFPGINTSAPFDEGLSLDGVLTALGLGLLFIHLAMWRLRGTSRGTQ